MKKIQEERISDKFRNHLSVFLFFNELEDVDFEKNNFIPYIYNLMKIEYNKLIEMASKINDPNLTEKLAKLAPPVIILKNYVQGYKTKADVLKSKEDLEIEDSINSILELLEK